jgi:ketosteroid isomerase-like protein
MADSRTLEQKIQELLDIEEIKRLKARYCFGCDGIPSIDVTKNRQVDFELVTSLFTDDATLEGVGRCQGRAAIREYYKGIQRLPLAIHSVTTPLIEVHGDAATGKWHGIIPLITAEEKVAAWLIGVYQDDFVRTADGWKIRKLGFTPHFLTPAGESWATTRYLDPDYAMRFGR